MPRKKASQPQPEGPRRRSERSAGKERLSYRESPDLDDDDPNKQWEFKAILDDRIESDGTKMYEVEWVPDKATGEEFKPDWVCDLTLPMDLVCGIQSDLLILQLPAGNIDSVSVEQYERGKALRLGAARRATVAGAEEHSENEVQDNGEELAPQTNASDDQKNPIVHEASDDEANSEIDEVGNISGPSTQASEPDRTADHPIPEPNEPTSYAFITEDTDDESIVDFPHNTRPASSEPQVNRMGRVQDEEDPDPVDDVDHQSMAEMSLNDMEGSSNQRPHSTPEQYLHQELQWMVKNRDEIEDQLRDQVCCVNFTKDKLIIFPKENDISRMHQPFELVGTIEDCVSISTRRHGYRQVKENILKTQLTKRQCPEPDPRPRRRKVASVFKDPYDTIPKQNSTKQMIIKLRINLDFQRGDNRTLEWGRDQTLECGQLCIRGLHVMSYFSGAVTTGLLFPIIPIIPSEIRTFDLLYEALESGGTKVTCCVPNLDLLDLDLLEFQPDWEEGSDEDSTSEVVPGSDGDDEADDGTGGDERESVEEDTAENDTVEKETVEKERNTNTHGRGRRRRRMSRRQRGKRPIGAGEDDGSGDDMDLGQ